MSQKVKASCPDHYKFHHYRWQVQKSGKALCPPPQSIHPNQVRVICHNGCVWACAPCVGELALAHLMLSRYRPQVIPRLHPFHTLCKQWVASRPYLMRTSAIKHLPATLEQSPALLYVPHVCVCIPVCFYCSISLC